MGTTYVGTEDPTSVDGVPLGAGLDTFQLSASNQSDITPSVGDMSGGVGFGGGTAIGGGFTLVQPTLPTINYAPDTVTSVPVGTTPAGISSGGSTSVATPPIVTGANTTNVSLSTPAATQQINPVQFPQVPTMAAAPAANNTPAMAPPNSLAALSPTSAPTMPTLGAAPSGIAASPTALQSSATYNAPQPPFPYANFMAQPAQQPGTPGQWQQPTQGGSGVPLNPAAGPVQQHMQPGAYPPTAGGASVPQPNSLAAMPPRSGLPAPPAAPQLVPGPPALAPGQAGVAPPPPIGNFGNAITHPPAAKLPQGSLQAKAAAQQAVATAPMSDPMREAFQAMINSAAASMAPIKEGMESQFRVLDKELKDERKEFLGPARDAVNYYTQKGDSGQSRLQRAQELDRKADDALDEWNAIQQGRDSHLFAKAASAHADVYEKALSPILKLTPDQREAYKTQAGSQAYAYYKAMTLNEQAEIHNAAASEAQSIRNGYAQAAKTLMDRLGAWNQYADSRRKAVMDAAELTYKAQNSLNEFDGHMLGDYINQKKFDILEQHNSNQDDIAAIGLKLKQQEAAAAAVSKGDAAKMAEIKDLRKSINDAVKNNLKAQDEDEATRIKGMQARLEGLEGGK